ncbi:MAG TPA: hypothetical protein VGK59_15950 [Ohtaekwangia sp.]
MFFRSSWLPARIPYTLILLPLFWLVLSISPNLNEWRSLWVLFITHGLLYGSVNTYVNFYAVRTKSINGLTVSYNNSDAWLYTAIVFHTFAVVLGFVYVNLTFALFTLLYGLITHTAGLTGILSRKTRLTWGIVRITQGLGATILYYIGLNDLPVATVLQLKILIPGLVSSLVLAALFPIPASGNDEQYSKKVFYQSIILLLTAAALSAWFFSTYVSPVYVAGVMTGFGMGVILLFQQHHTVEKDAHNTLFPVWIHWLATIALNGYSFYIFTDYTQIFQLVQ